MSETSNQLVEGQVNGHEDGTSGLVIDGDEGWQGDDGLLEAHHSVVVLPKKVNILPHGIDEGRDRLAWTFESSGTHLSYMHFVSCTGREGSGEQQPIQPRRTDNKSGPLKLGVVQDEWMIGAAVGMFVSSGWRRGRGGGQIEENQGGLGARRDSNQQKKRSCEPSRQDC